MEKIIVRQITFIKKICHITDETFKRGRKYFWLHLQFLVILVDISRLDKNIIDLSCSMLPI